MKLSKTDIAFEIIEQNKEGMSFADLWSKVCDEAGINSEAREELVSIFYTDLSLDGRFITLGDNVWDLRKNHPFEKVHIDMNDIYSDDLIGDEDDDIAEDIEN